jgi:glucans biosynthesis protein C
MARTVPATDLRRPGLDRLRVGVMLAVVLLHAAIPFAMHSLPGLTWPTRHQDPSAAVDVLMWTCLLLVMPVFFWLSGYGAAQSLGRDGTQRFLQSRWRRIGRPGLVFAALLLPIELHVWVGGWVMDGLIPLRKLQSFKLGIYDAGLWGPSNLWYLQNLFLYCCLFAAWRHWVKPNCPRLWTDGPRSILSSWSDRLYRIECAFTRMGAHPLSSLMLVLPGLFMLAVRPVKFVWLGLFFVAGAIRQQNVQRDPIAIPLRTSLRVLIAGLVTLVVAAPLLLMYLEDPSAARLHARLTMNPDPAQFAWTFRLALAGLIATGVVLTTRGLTETALNDQQSTSTALQRWSRASYWIYLIHHPIAAACHLPLSRTGWPADVQFVVAATLTLGLSWLSYGWFVEHTFVGTFLDGQPQAATTVRTATVSKQAA